MASYIIPAGFTEYSLADVDARLHIMRRFVPEGRTPLPWTRHAVMYGYCDMQGTENAQRIVDLLNSNINPLEGGSNA